MRVDITLVVLGAFGLSASAIAQQKKPLVEWAINPYALASPRIEVASSRGPWRILDHQRSVIVEMSQPLLKKGYRFNFGQCKVGGVLRQDVIAMVKHTKDVEWSQDVAMVWIAEPKDKRFSARDGSGVECRNSD